MSRRLRQGIALEHLALGLLFVLFSGRALLMPAQDDTFWHLRAGADIWRTGEVALVDRYSFTVFGEPWPDHEWLWQALAYAGERAGGMPLVTLGCAAAVIGSLWLVYRLMVGPPRARFVLMALGTSLATSAWVLRPQVVTLLCVPLLVTLLARERWWPIPVLFLLWANAHGGVTLGGAILAAVTLAAAVCWCVRRTAAARRRLLALAPILVFAFFATCVTPLGFGIFHFINEFTARLASLGGIEEWQAPLPNTALGAAFYAALLALAVLALARGRRLLHAIKTAVPEEWPLWVLTAAALVSLPLALSSVRHIAPFMLLATPLASRLLGADFRLRTPWRSATASASREYPRVNLALLAAAALGMAAVVGRCWATRHAALGWQPIDDAALAAVRTCDGPLYNHYDAGGALIWFVPEKPVFIDTRADPYPLPFLLDFIAVEQGQKPYQPLFERWGIRCAFLPLASRTVAELGRSGWQSRFRDESWAVLAAPAGPTGDAGN
jgi:hypothetical protein